MNLKIKPFSQFIYDLYKNHDHFFPGDAGLDLFVIEDTIINPYETVKIHLGIACENSENRPYLLMPRSSISKTPLRLCNSIGLIDAGYRGEIIAAVDNIKNKSYKIKVGERLFQLVSMNGSAIKFRLVDKLTETDRGTGGFGSTGR